MKKYDYWLATLENYGVGSVARRNLKKALGNAKAVYEATERELSKINTVSEKARDAVLKHKKSKELLSKDYTALLSKHIIMISEEDEKYPQRLKEINGMPDILFVKGHLPYEDKLTVSIVGSRHASAYGIKVTEYFAEGLAKLNTQIISGMAYGIDSCAHKQALNSGSQTFAVMGCGIDICYPADKIDLYEQIRLNGGIISEFACGVSPLPFRFPMRNRIIAGLSDIIIVVEARKKSGSLITANFALEQGKDVYVVPGRIDDINSEGCNALWFEGAVPALSIDTIIESSSYKKLLYIEETRSKKITDVENLGIAMKNDIVYSCLDLHPKGVEEIVKITGKSPEEVLTNLVRLQLQGLAEESTRGFYIKK